MYVMTRFDAGLFPPEEAEAFVEQLFAGEIGQGTWDREKANFRVRPEAAPRTRLSKEDAAEIKAHIIRLYRQFLAEGETAQNWEEPLLSFMRQMPSVF
jgi:hypothetical protein